MLIATPDTMWSTPNVTVATACSSPPSAPPITPHEHAGPRPPLPSAPRAEPGAEDHHPLEADVDDAGALCVEATERRQADRARRGAARRRTCRSTSGRSRRCRPAPRRAPRRRRTRRARCRATTAAGGGGRDCFGGPCGRVSRSVLMPAPAQGSRHRHHRRRLAARLSPAASRTSAATRARRTIS